MSKKIILVAATRDRIVGGLSNATIVSAICQSLPVGIPKIILSCAAGMGKYNLIGRSDIAVVSTVLDTESAADRSRGGTRAIRFGNKEGSPVANTGSEIAPPQFDFTTFSRFDSQGESRRRQWRLIRSYTGRGLQ